MTISQKHEVMMALIYAVAMAKVLKDTEALSRYEAVLEMFEREVYHAR